MFYSLVRPLLFNLPAESAHDLMIQVAKLSPALGSLTGSFPDKRCQLAIGNLTWMSPVGLAAGLDKNAEAISFFSTQGFGALESGTVTLKPQLGNPKPRIFRYEKDFSLRNSMGFPNQGLEQVKKNILNSSRKIPLGINLGQNKSSSPEESIDEIATMAKSLNACADYFVINVSSPNTPGLRRLQDPSYLKELHQEIRSRVGKDLKDLYLKISPDLESKNILELGQFASSQGLTGMIATNTTIIPDLGLGGVSGRWLKKKSNHVLELLLKENFPIEIIGVGGMDKPEDLFAFWQLGGKAIQIYSSYVFGGPKILKNFNREVLSFLNRYDLKYLESFFYLSLQERQKMIGDYVSKKNFKYFKAYYNWIYLRSLDNFCTCI
jgi:dihydroorotate dehydrogenase